MKEHLESRFPAKCNLWKNYWIKCICYNKTFDTLNQSHIMRLFVKYQTSNLNALSSWCTFRCLGIDKSSMRCPDS